MPAWAMVIQRVRVARFRSRSAESFRRLKQGPSRAAVAARPSRPRVVANVSTIHWRPHCRVYRIPGRHPRAQSLRPQRTAPECDTEVLKEVVFGHIIQGNKIMRTATRVEDAIHRTCIIVESYESLLSLSRLSIVQSMFP